MENMTSAWQILSAPGRDEGPLHWQGDKEKKTSNRKTRKLKKEEIP
jgi:hypothetical protein